MKVHLEPTGLFSRAMIRVARALEAGAPVGVKIVQNRNEADIAVVHVIGRDSLDETEGRDRVLIQYCHATAGGTDWPERWAEARLVWSYYDLTKAGIGNNFYKSPLGIDLAFTNYQDDGAPRDLGILTSGYVSHPAAEAIEEAAWASMRAGWPSVHLGPESVAGMDKYPPSWNAAFGISDVELAALYGRCRYVSGLRHAEGFEMPCVEGLACGARPIVFERPDMRAWYDGHAVFVPETSGEELVDSLTTELKKFPCSVSRHERAAILEKFGWKGIVRGFWERALS